LPFVARQMSNWVHGWCVREGTHLSNPLTTGEKKEFGQGKGGVEGPVSPEKRQNRRHEVCGRGNTKKESLARLKEKKSI